MQIKELVFMEIYLKMRNVAFVLKDYFVLFINMVLEMAKQKQNLHIAIG